MRVLVVENDGLTAHDVAYVIRDLKSEVAGIATTSADALDMISSEPLDAAVLDVSLHDGTSEVVAAELQRRHIPYFLISGWPDQAQLPPPLNCGQMLQKPYREEDLVSNLKDLSKMAYLCSAGMASSL